MTHRTKILLVDDKEANLVALRQLLESEDLEIFCALTAEEALNLILDEDFGLAMLDVQMPGITGFELARLIRGVQRSRHLPIIFVTAERGEQSTVFKGYESGAVDFLQKPLDAHTVRSKVRVFVELDLQRKELKDQYEQMTQLKEAAEEASVAKSRFLANMSHEIRTPMSAVLGFADMILESDGVEAEILGFAERIKNNGQQLLKVIDDILDLAKVEAGKVLLSREKVQVTSLVQDVLGSLDVLAKNKAISLEMTVEEPFPERILTDGDRLRQILLNVIGNGIKFTLQGGVKVHLRYKASSATAGLMALDVEDTGIGISEEGQSRLFQAFVQGDLQVNRRFGGTGLGLLLSKRLAQALGGDLVICRSQVGVGSVFRLMLNVEVVADKKADADALQKGSSFSFKDMLARRPLEGLRVLLVEDIPDNQFLIRTIVEGAGAKVALAQNGLEGVQQAQASNFDLILMDVQMPVLDGLSATRQLRASGYKKPIVALTAHALKEEIDRSYAAGCDGHISKPVNFHSLIHKLEELRSPLA